MTKTFAATNPCKRAGAFPSPASSAHQGRFLPGTIIANRYRIVALAGKGGMGEVYRADDIKLGHSVALKFLPRDVSDDPERLNFFHGEVRLARQISHPNVSRVYDIGEVHGQHFLSMEYIDGEDLSILLRRIGRLQKDNGIQIVRQLCAGLAAAHERGVLHRDLKPANVMLDGRGQVRITDFGLARLVGDSGDQQIVGTPAYMAPEQLQYGKTTIQSDLYSLGLICYELFTGEPVHKSNSIPELLQSHQQESITLPSSVQEDIDPAVERVILRCVEHEAYQRPKSVQEVLAALPGADPLAVALAAGETPSPELVAAAGESRRIDSRLATLCLVTVILLVILNALLADRTSILDASGLKSQPAVMADVARQILERDLGYGCEDGIEIYGVLRSTLGFDNAYRFWFRRRPPGQEFYMNEYWSDFGKQSRARPSFGSPQWQVPEEVGMVLSGERKLTYFRARPPRVVEPQTSPELNWSEWVTPELTGYYLSGSTQEPRQDLPASTVIMEKVSDLWRLPNEPFDHLAAWKGQDPTFDENVYVIAASFQNKPTFYRRLLESELASIGAGKSSWRSTIWLRKIWLLCLLVIQAVAVVMAWRHYFSGRGDRRGAMRLATFRRLDDPPAVEPGVENALVNSTKGLLRNFLPASDGTPYAVYASSVWHRSLLRSRSRAPYNNRPPRSLGQRRHS